MQMHFENEGVCNVDIHTDDGFVTVVLTELSENFLKNKYEAVATKLYHDRFKGKIDPKTIVWLGHLPKEGHFEILMPWHGDHPGYGQALWYKRK